MNHPDRLLALVALVVLPFVAAAGDGAGGDAAGDTAFVLESGDFAPRGKLADTQVYAGFGCSGDNLSPALSWKNAPEGTQSFALMVHDPDAPTGSGWWHWTVWNIPATVTSLPTGAGTPDNARLPPGAVQGRTDFGSIGYGGPCPPPGAAPHHYHFRLHALKVSTLEIPPQASAAFVGFNVNANTLAVAELTGVYWR